MQSSQESYKVHLNQNYLLNQDTVISTLEGKPANLWPRRILNLVPDWRPNFGNKGLKQSAEVSKHNCN